MKTTKLKHKMIHTPIIQYERDGLLVKAIGVYHIGMPDFYARVQEELDNVQFGFFEGVKPSVGMELPPEKKSYVENFQLKEVYEKFAMYTGFVTQTSSIKYPDNWENPDMNLDELILALPTEALDEIWDMSKNIHKFDRFFYQSEEACETMFRKIFYYSRKFPTSLLFKKNSFDSKLGEVILRQRNDLLFDAVDLYVENPTHEELGIIYGAAHLIDLDKHLKKNGFSKEKREWIPVIDLNTQMSTYKAFKELFLSNGNRTRMNF